MAKRGRPSREPTEAERKKVKELLEVTASLADMARMLGYSKPTFRKYFSAEIFAAKKIPEQKSEPLKICDADRVKVVRYVGCQMSLEQVALAMDMTEEQLEQHFPEEIKK